jgi:MFS superfamily sulfate permease-like transporter
MQSSASSPARQAVTAQALPTPDQGSLWQRLVFFLSPVDGRYEDVKRGDWRLNVLRDFTAGLIVAMVAIPLAMGFAMASGLRPEQGIVGGAIAGLIGALFGGSKYQVYGPTAAFIPIIGGLMASYDHAFLVLASLLASAVLLFFGPARFGRIVAMVPHSIVVGFTIGIAVTIGMSQVGELLGLNAKLGFGFLDKISVVASHLGEISVFAVALGLGTFALTKYILKVSVYIPAPLLAIGITTVVAATVWADKGLALVQDRYGRIPTDFWVFTPPAPLPWGNPQAWFDLAYFVIAIVFVAAIESLLCSRMADRLAENRGQDGHDDQHDHELDQREPFGLGHVQAR